MENQPLISPQSRFRLEPLPENPNPNYFSSSTTSLSQEIVHHHDLKDLSFTNPRSLHRCHSAPEVAIINDLVPKTIESKKPSPISKPIIKQASLLLFLYLVVGVLIYSMNRDHYSGVKTHPVVDALYFCIVTMCTIGYGDIAPLTSLTKFFAVVFVCFGFWVLGFLFSAVVNLHERIQMGSTSHHRGRMKVGLGLCALVLCIGVGSLVLYFVEGLDFVDSVYLSVMSVTTVGYGDKAFKTLQGRLFAAAWLLVSTLALVCSFLYIAEARIDYIHRKTVESVLNKEITVEDFLAADTYQHGFINKSEYIVMKLKEMGKISDRDINQIVNQFDKLDTNNLGKITLPDLLSGRV